MNLGIENNYATAAPKGVGLFTKEGSVLKALRLFDDNKTVKISLKNLKQLVKEFGECATDEEHQDIFDKATSNMMAAVK